MCPPQGGPGGRAQRGVSPDGPPVASTACAGPRLHTLGQAERPSLSLVSHWGGHLRSSRAQSPAESPPSLCRY